jgi:TonB family protein
MFEFAISHNRKQPPSRRLLASWIASCAGHVAMVLILLEYPQLLRSGFYQMFRQPANASLFSPDQQWRTSTFVGSKMEMPPLEVLKKYIYDFNRAKASSKPVPPIRVNLRRTEDQPAVAAVLPNAPATPNSMTIPLAGAATIPVQPANPAAGDPKNTSKAGPPATPPDAAPKQIPKGVTDPSTPPGPPAGTGANQTQARPQPSAPAGSKPQDQQVSMQGSGLFDTKGFPLEEYANLVMQRVKEKWLIPSNLRYSQGSTTVVFYIGKDGQSVDVHIDVTSGNYSLDIAALQAVIGSNPFPPLPKGFPADRVGARFVFAYNER